MEHLSQYQIEQKMKWLEGRIKDTEEDLKNYENRYNDLQKLKSK